MKKSKREDGENRVTVKILIACEESQTVCKAEAMAEQWTEGL